MRGLFLPLGLLVLIWAIAASTPAVAQEAVSGASGAVESAEPAEPAASAEPAGEGWSGPGFYLSLTKLSAAWFLLLVWAGTTDWVSRDAQEFNLPYLRWNPLVFGLFLAAFVVMWFLPWFAAGFPLALLAWAVPLTCYIVSRNKQVGDHEKVLTRHHLRHWMAERVAKVGVKVDVEEKDPHETGPPVILTSRGGDQRDDNVHLLTARQAPGFTDARRIIADALTRRSDALMLDYTQQAVGVRYLIDGVWHQGESLEREMADPALEALKALSGLNPQDRQGRQEGIFTAAYERNKYDATCATQGTRNGERVVVKFEGTRTPFKTLDDLGMRPKMQEQLRELLSLKQGLLIFSALPAGGLRSTLTIALGSVDRFVREFMSFEDEENRYEEVENVMVTTYRKNGEISVSEAFDRFFLKEPEVAVVADLLGGEMLGMICEEINSNQRLVVTTVRAKDCAEALVRVLALKPPQQEFARAISAVLNQRLVRRLCDQCKEAYAPPPNVLAQLGIPAGRVQAFYRPPQEVDPKDICQQCGGIGYFGRTAMFELLVVDDGVRDVLASKPSVNGLRQAARRAGMQNLQQEGIVLVAKGVTSLPELMRVLKQ